ncbi:serine hydrolase domain-containing protein [Agrilutibacter solisilvae]|uniref:Beta-lactamase family protein n=1 Tax=Agrilutibacter solisilvae TaxID=2763317 RepID=A0A974XZL0_9GAMM|nr:serine hydrolase domain-containing protein [Lysobacter solisilvae]QSX78687.1 beta-lactamase family protein [Lysobacter solisilvae]
MNLSRARGVLLALAWLPALASAAAPGLLCPHADEAIDAAAAKTMQQGSPGMLVGIYRRGQPDYVRGYGLANLEHRVPMRPQAVFNLASVTKQFTAAAVLLMVQDGKLRLDDRLDRYVPTLPQASRVTIRQLLLQTSGLPDYAEDPAEATSGAVARTPDEMVQWIAGLQPSLAFEPGSAWRYSNSNYVLLGKVVEQVSGEPLQAVFARRLFAPAGMTDTAFDDPTQVVPGRTQGYRRDKQAPGGFANARWLSPTVPGAAGGLRTTLADLARWTQALHGGRILHEELLRTMTSPGHLDDGRTTKLGMPQAWQEGLDADYGMGVFINASPFGHRIWHSGDMPGFSTWLAYYPLTGVTIALAINSESADLPRDEIERLAFACVGVRE